MRAVDALAYRYHQITGLSYLAVPVSVDSYAEPWTEGRTDSPSQIYEVAASAFCFLLSAFCFLLSTGPPFA